jgi:pSer/pThr/pTyr-binding forkhead associated (FHA) protein
MRDLRVVRIRCEIEVEDDREFVPIEQAGVISPRVLRAGMPVQLGCANLSMVAAQPTVAAPVVETPDSTPTATGPNRLKVIDGGDQGSTFRLPESGTRTVGKPGGAASIGLHDLYVMRVHCSLEIADGVVTVTHVEGQSGTLIDGQRITTPRVFKPGSVLRVGNSHLRLEVGPFHDEPAVTEADTSGPTSGVMRAPPKAPPPPPAKAADPLEQLEGQHLGAYELGKMLGRGHFGAVFHATHAKTGQVVALKVLAAEFPASAAELDHFAQELKAAQQVRHANLVTPIGAGRSGSHCWIARELVEGESAAAVIERISEGEKPSWTRAARVATHLARVLDCLHQNRLVHGNITPRNVLLRAADHATKLADLRLSQALEGSQLQRAVLEKKLLAELPYLAPEQTEPGGFVDELADLYAVGAVSYALITGRPPVRGRTPEDILAEIQAGRVVRPSAFYKKVPATFDAIVMKLLALHQEDRYPSSAALLRDLAPIAETHDLKL